MLNPNQLSWRLFGSVVAVMVLVFGALISSWVGMNAEEDGKQAVFEASSLARDALDVKSLAAGLAAAQSVYALDVLRDPAGANREHYLRLLAQLRERLAAFDEKSLPANEQAVLRAARGAMERARRTGQRCSVGIIDLDHFKRFNGSRGHPAGDALLKSFAQTLARQLRTGDLVARYGGEEFAVLLHQCDTEKARQLFARLHECVPEGQTFSAGIADTDGQEDERQAVSRADEALYRAKAAGRNRTEDVALPPPSRAAAA